MKKRPLDIAILVCLIIIIILLILLLWPIDKKSESTNSKKDTETKEVVENDGEEKLQKDTSEDSNQTLFTDTSKASNENEVVSYIQEVEQEVENLSRQSSSNKSVKEKLEDTFITLTDFIFYGGTIKGMTFSELTDSAKEKVLSLYESMDSKIESYFPNYKENIKDTAKKGYTTVVEKAKSLKDSIVSKYKETVGEEQYNNVVGSFEEDKSRFQDAYSPYVEKGKEIGSKAVDKAKDAIGSATSKLDTWYQEFKESR